MSQKKIFKLTFALPMVLGGFALGATYPENDLTDRPMTTDPGTKVQDPAVTNRPVTPDVGAKMQNPAMPGRMATTTVRAGKLIGTAVLTKDDKSLGDIKDIILDRDLKKAGFTVISCNDLGGLNDKLAAVPYSQLHFDMMDKGKARLAIGEMAIRTAPMFAKNDWPTPAVASEYYTKSDDYYTHMPRTTPTDMRDAKGTVEPENAIPAAGKIGGSDLMWTRRASELIGRSVQNSRGEGLGELKDIVIDWSTGDVRYGVLSFGGMMGIGDRLFAVPIEQFKTQPADKFLILDVDKEQLKRAPGFDKDHWPDFTKSDWHQSVDTFYAKPGTAVPDNGMKPGTAMPDNGMKPDSAMPDTKTNRDPAMPDTRSPKMDDMGH